MNIVSCGDPEARWKVIHRVDGISTAIASTACAGVEQSSATYWRGVEGGDAYALCLANAP